MCVADQDELPHHTSPGSFRGPIPVGLIPYAVNKSEATQGALRNRSTRRISYVLSGRFLTVGAYLSCLLFGWVTVLLSYSGILEKSQAAYDRKDVR